MVITILQKLPPGKVTNFNKYIGTSGFYNESPFTRYHAYVQLQRLLQNKSILRNAKNITFERELTGTLGKSVSDIRVTRIDNSIIEIETKAGDEFFAALTGETNFVTQCSNSLEAVDKLEDYKVFLRPSKVAELKSNEAALSAAKTRVINAWKAKGVLENAKIQSRFKDFFELSNDFNPIELEQMLMTNSTWFESIFLNNL